MLQQTRVETVVPYYERWTSRFPDVRRLAEAGEAEVLRLWEGLGYYSRARNLHRAARLVHERLDGAVPSDPAELRRLPGIGDYTAGAIASIAYGVPAPAVDGNVRRVLARLLDLPRPRASLLRRVAADLVDPHRPGRFNQALMELGSLVCTPRSPACERCPIADLCAARAAETQLERPLPRRAAPVPEGDVGTASVVAADGRLLLRRRPSEGLLGGLWELPGEECGPGEDPAAGAANLAFALCAATGATAPRSLGHACTVSHTFSHKRLRYHAFRFATEAPAVAPAAGGAPSPPGLDPATSENPRPDLAWVPPDALTEYALPRAQRRIIEMSDAREG